MQFVYQDLGHRNAGEIIEVALGSAANVRLMDATNFQKYRSGQRHNYHGGFAQRSPVLLPVPRHGRWYVTIDLGGYSGQVRYNIRVLPGALPPLNPVNELSRVLPPQNPVNEVPLSSLPSLIQEQPPEYEDGGHQRFDVFISHASEDKNDVVRPLAHALQETGLSVWYDEFELRIGDSLRRKIDRGLANSRFGIVVLSQAFFGKGWTNYELDGLVTRSISGEQILLPIWHNVSKQEVMHYSASLADKVARNTTTHTVQEIAAEIAEVIRGA